MRFATGFISADHFRYPAVRYRGRNWHILFGPQSVGIPTINSHVGRRVIPAKEVFITAKSERIARAVASNIVGAMVLLQGSSVLIPELTDAIELHEIAGLRGMDEVRSAAAEVRRLYVGHWSTDDFPLACRIASRVTHSLSLQYAVSKFRLSTESASFHFADLDPNNSDIIPRWHRAEDHVRLATAIVLAYSVIEELGLEVRASNQKPSSINGHWNPDVKHELEIRLARAGIDFSNPVVWSIRGGRSRLEAARPGHLFATTKRTPWTRWNVRDRLVDVVDAIGHASFLRSRVSSHRLRPDLARMLSAYDVSNVQLLARRLFLAKLGYWPQYTMLKRAYQPKAH